MTIAQLLTKNPKQRPGDVELLWNELNMGCQFIEDPRDTPERYSQL